jgi:hypothetical protein
MQTKYLLPKATNYATTGGFTGPIQQYNPISSTVGLLMLSVVSTTTAAVTVGSATIELQGSVDDVEWFTILSTPIGSLKLPVNTVDIGTATGTRTYVQVVQTMPHMRIVTSGALLSGAGAATTYLRAMILNG